MKYIRKISAIIFFLSLILFWSLYFFPGIIPVTDDYSNTVFVRTVGAITILNYISITILAITLFIKSTKAEKLLGGLILTYPLFPILISIFNALITDLDQFLILNDILSIFVALLAFIVSPIIGAILIKKDRIFLMILSGFSFLFWTIAIIFGQSPSYVLYTRWGGLNGLDFLYTIIQMPFLIFVGYLAFKNRSETNKT